MKFKVLEDQLNRWGKEVQTAWDKGGAELTNLRKNAGTILTNLRKEATNAAENAYKAYADGAVLLVDAAKASARFAERELAAKKRALSTGVDLVRKGRPLDAIWETTYTPLKNTSKNAAMATQESVLLNVAGSVAASTYGGPGGTAAYAAWTTYNTTKDLGMALRAAIVAGASAQASAAIAKIPANTASEIVGKVMAKAAFQQTQVLIEKGKFEFSKDFVREVVKDVASATSGLSTEEAQAAEVALLMAEGDHEKIKDRLADFCAKQVTADSPLSPAQIQALQGATRLAITTSLTLNSKDLKAQATAELKVQLLSAVTRDIERHIDPELLNEKKHEIVKHALAAAGAAMLKQPLPDPGRLLQNSARDFIVQDQKVQQAMLVLGETKAKLEDAKTKLAGAKAELEKKLKQAVPDLDKEIANLRSLMPTLEAEIKTLDGILPDLEFNVDGFKIEAPVLPAAVNEVAGTLTKESAARAAQAAQRLTMTVETFQRAEKFSRAKVGEVLSPAARVLEGKATVGVVGEWALSVNPGTSEFVLTEIGPGSLLDQTYQEMERELAKNENTVAETINATNQLLDRIPLESAQPPLTPTAPAPIPKPVKPKREPSRPDIGDRGPGGTK